MSGAVIGTKESYDVKAEAGAEASTSDSVTDGTYVTITEVSGAHAKIEFRKGTAMATGWINAALFSPQPKVAKDNDDKDLPEDVSYELAEGEQTPGDEIEGSDVEQGGLADCFFIASLNAIANADPKFFEDAMTYDKGSGMYSVRFYERSGYNYEEGGWDYSEHTEVVDGYLPTRANGENAYAQAKNASEWGAIYEKAYAQWKGGYAELDKGGSSSKSMQELTGVQSVPQSVSGLKTDEIIPFFENAQENGTAVICGSQESMESAAQTPLQGGPAAAPEEVAKPEVEAAPTEESTTEVSTETEAPEVEAPAPAEEEEEKQVFHAGPYAGHLTTDNARQRVKPGTVEVRDAGGNVGSARDTGSRGDKEAEMTGGDVAGGKIAYKAKNMELTYNDGKGPAKASDLEVKFRYQGLIFPGKKIFAWHAYVFKEVKDGKIQLYNPWGSWHPDPITAEELQTYFSNLSTNQVPQTKETEAGE
jgi:hypothetical protein